MNAPCYSHLKSVGARSAERLAFQGACKPITTLLLKGGATRAAWRPARVPAGGIDFTERANPASELRAEGARTAQRARPYLRKVGRRALRGAPPAFQRAEQISRAARNHASGLRAEGARTAQRARPYPRKVGRLALRGVPPAFSGRNRFHEPREITPPSCALRARGRRGAPIPTFGR